MIDTAARPDRVGEIMAHVDGLISAEFALERASTDRMEQEAEATRSQHRAAIETAITALAAPPVGADEVVVRRQDVEEALGWYITAAWEAATDVMDEEAHQRLCAALAAARTDAPEAGG